MSGGATRMPPEILRGLEKLLPFLVCSIEAAKRDCPTGYFDPEELNEIGAALDFLAKLIRHHRTQ